MRALLDREHVPIDNLVDVDTVSTTPVNNYVLTWSSANGVWQPAAAPGATGGEANTGSNQGTDGVGVYDTKVGVDLQFRNIAPASNKITVNLNTKDIDIDVVEANFAVPVAGIDATGTPSSSTFLRGDGTWSSATGSGIGGSIADNQIAVGATTADEIEGSAGLTFDSATNALEIGENGRFNLGNGHERIMWNNTGNGSVTIYQDSQPVIDISGTNNVTMQWGNLTVGSNVATNGVISLDSSVSTSTVLDFYRGGVKQSELRNNITTGDLEIRTQVATNEVAVYTDLGFEAIRWDASQDTLLSGYIAAYPGTPGDGDVLTWVNANGRAEFTPAGGGGVTSIDDLSDVDTATVSPTLGDSLLWDGTNWVTNLTQLSKEVDFVGTTTIYIGEAQPGTATSAASWRVKRVVFTGDDSTTLFADGNSNFDNIWDNRASLSYS
jgi:hypothetical protein